MWSRGEAMHNAVSAERAHAATAVPSATRRPTMATPPKATGPGDSLAGYVPITSRGHTAAAGGTARPPGPAAEPLPAPGIAASDIIVQPGHPQRPPHEATVSTAHLLAGRSAPGGGSAGDLLPGAPRACRVVARTAAAVTA